MAENFEKETAGEPEDSGVNRRDLMKAGAALSAIAAASGTGGAATAMPGPSLAGETFGERPRRRAAVARILRFINARKQFFRARSMTNNFREQSNNGDESLYSDFRGSFSKTLVHDANGLVDPASYNSFLQALDSRDPADFDAIIVGNPGQQDRIGLVAPQAAFSFDQSAVDSNLYRMPDAPAFASAETAVEMGELYHYALTRDVPFTDYDSDPLIGRAVNDLNNNFSATNFLTDGAPLTSANIFRSTLPGADVGPFVSQFLYQPFNFGRLAVTQRYIQPAAGAVNDFMDDNTEYLAIQNGAAPSEQTTFSNDNQFIATMRDLAEFVHVDFPIQSPLYAFLILLERATNNPELFDPNLPYIRTALLGVGTQDPFTSFGAGGLPHLVCQAPRIGLLGAWFQKWAAHRRLRPEVYGSRVNNTVRALDGDGSAILFDVHGDILNSDALADINARNSAGNQGLLPMGYPEGSPAHPAYPGGHSTFAAAGATICKAIFNEDAEFPDPVVSNRAGTGLRSWNGTPLTVGGELNKLVGNITHGRDGAGMHWRSDGRGNFIGENVAITLLCDYSRTYNDAFDGFQLTRFNGQKIRIVNGNILNA